MSDASLKVANTLADDTMDGATLEALKASIKKWKLHTEAKMMPRLDATECPLCTLFYLQDCIGCPVAQKVKLPGCLGTPYSTAKNARWEGSVKQFHEAAQKELDFLRSLLPSKPRPTATSLVAEIVYKLRQILNVKG